MNRVSSHSGVMNHFSKMQKKKKKNFLTFGKTNETISEFRMCNVHKCKHANKKLLESW